MIALSIKNPWAWAIFHGGKDIENREWTTNLRGRVLIHAGQTIDEKGIEYLRDCHNLEYPKNYNRGGIIGSVEIIDCVDKSKSKWFFGKYGFVLRKPIQLPFFPLRGKLGFFYVDYHNGGL